MVFKLLKSNKGITLIELIIVLAIIAILGAIVVPNFLGITDRARARSDIQSTIVIRNAAELYRLERGSAPIGDIDAVLTTLFREGYLQNDLGPEDTQTNGAAWSLSDNRVYLTLPDNIFTEIEGFLSDQERNILTNSIN